MPVQSNLLIQYLFSLSPWGIAIAAAIALIVVVAVIYLILRIFVDDEKASAFASYVLFGGAGILGGAFAGLFVGLITAISANSFDAGFYATMAIGCLVGCIMAYRSIHSF